MCKLFGIHDKHGSSNLSVLGSVKNALTSITNLKALFPKLYLEFKL